jgi:hypothetical protein
VELLTAICNLLSRSDLKNVRRLSRQWAVAAQSALFGTLFLRIDLESFEKLQDISRDSKLSRCVRKISYDGRTLGADAARRGYEAWVRCSAGWGLGLVWEAREELVKQVSDRELETCYINYLETVFNQEWVLRRNNEKETLADALEKLPMLSAIEYVVPRQPSGSCNAPPLDSLNPRVRRILAQPEDTYGYEQSDGHFWALLQAACQTGRPLTSVQGSHLNLKCWNAAAAKSLPDCRDVLPTLQHLSLEFELEQHSKEDATTLATIMAQAPSLQSLRLSFDELSWDDPLAVIRLPYVIDHTVQWNHLQHLSLQAIAATEGGLRSLLLTHSASLRSLDLSNMKLRDTDIPDQTQRGSWIHFIHFLSKELSLKHIRFDGCFSNSWDEGWVTRDADYEMRFGATHFTPYPDNCLKYRIESYITHGGVSPFTARMGKKTNYEDYSSHGLPWSFDEDVSWRFEHHLVQ